VNAQAGETRTGASTITQQLVKNVLLTDEEQQQSYQRKIKEAVIAQQLTEEYSKEKILELYLNDNNYGDRNYGIQAAAQGYFGVDAKDVSLNQATLLAGLPQSPTTYNLRDHVDGDVLRGVQLKPGWLNPARDLPNGTTPPRARQIDVLRRMVDNRMLTEREAREVVAQDVQLVPRRDIENLQLKQQAPHFIDFVQEQLENDPELGPILQEQGGLAITTTIDLRINNLVQQEVRDGIDALRSRNANNAAVVVQQPNTGQILAMVGSVDYNASTPTDTPGEEGNVVDGEVNVATRERQPGSALKPFVYLTSLLDNQATPGSIYWDVDTRFAQIAGASDANINSCVPEGVYWYCPKNYDRRWHGPLRMRDALANSLNIPAVLAMKANGVQRTIDVLHAAGITGLQRTGQYGLALSLGGGEVKLLDLTTAYNTLANDGNYIATTPILKITDRNGNVLREAKPTPQRRFDAAKVALIRDFMDDDAARTPIFGPNNNLVLSRPSPVKTGTTNDYRDGWAMGFTPYVTVGVWTGNNNNEPINSAGGVDTGGRIWNSIMERMFDTPEIDGFLRDGTRIPLEFPELETYGLVQQRVCSVGTAFGRRTTEWFTEEMLENQAGTTECGLYRTIRAVQTADGSVCLPRQGVNYGSALTEVRVWNVPKPTDDTRIVGSYSSGTGTSAAPQNVCAANVQLEQPKPSATPRPSASAAPTTPRTSPAPGQSQPAPSVAPQPKPPAPVPSAPPVPAPSVPPASVPPAPAPSVPPAPAPSAPPVQP
jgi:peptidoglycan glycosyltransferase